MHRFVESRRFPISKWKYYAEAIPKIYKLLDSFKLTSGPLWELVLGWYQQHRWPDGGVACGKGTKCKFRRLWLMSKSRHHLCDKLEHYGFIIRSKHCQFWLWWTRQTTFTSNHPSLKSMLRVLQRTGYIKWLTNIITFSKIKEPTLKSQRKEPWKRNGKREKKTWWLSKVRNPVWITASVLVACLLTLAWGKTHVFKLVPWTTPFGCLIFTCGRFEPSNAPGFVKDDTLLGKTCISWMERYMKQINEAAAKDSVKTIWKLSVLQELLIIRNIFGKPMGQQNKVGRISS